jgi:hypothetical protein
MALTNMAGMRKLARADAVPRLGAYYLDKTAYYDRRASRRDTIYYILGDGAFLRISPRGAPNDGDILAKCILIVYN